MWRFFGVHLTGILVKWIDVIFIGDIYLNKELSFNLKQYTLHWIASIYNWWRKRQHIKTWQVFVIEIKFYLDYRISVVWDIPAFSTMGLLNLKCKLKYVYASLMLFRVSRLYWKYVAFDVIECVGKCLSKWQHKLVDMLLGIQTSCRSYMVSIRGI